MEEAWIVACESGGALAATVKTEAVVMGGCRRDRFRPELLRRLGGGSQVSG
jgi:hypothetical protein